MLTADAARTKIGQGPGKWPARRLSEGLRDRHHGQRGRRAPHRRHLGPGPDRRRVRLPRSSLDLLALRPRPGPDYLDTDKARGYADAVGRNAARNLVTVAGALKAIEFPIPEKTD